MSSDFTVGRNATPERTWQSALRQLASNWMDPYEEYGLPDDIEEACSRILIAAQASERRAQEGADQRWQSALKQLADTLAPGSNVQIDSSDPEESCARIVDAVEALQNPIPRAKGLVAIDGARLRHWRSGANVPYPGMLHNPQTDERIYWATRVGNILSALAEGDRVSIVVVVEPPEQAPDPDDYWELLEPHVYGPHPKEGTNGSTE